MTKKIYRTAQGKVVDLGALQMQNENVRAVGNMKVNARGDLLDEKNRTIASRNDQVSKQYQKQVTNVVDTPIFNRKQKPQNRPARPAATTQPPAATATQPPTEPAPKKISQVEHVVVEHTEESGLAAAIARARQVKQEPLKPANQSTIKKI